ncbi:transcription factor PHYTOCHROME INTERACTING FACTOR-LIKE 13-like [Nymphaea colorata]|uniref:transcription factor PHYTOCHROME INTERACTING FACTOR-LIKE 13-like n=1 Tax=Nymphaea colorata TaxID=210225 RepID=UPI00129EE583|nr:transcription factor PHYTOCHROME INTERACTING FACTOR-LIKE 13-like [Nymphaea colorata]
MSDLDEIFGFLFAAGDGGSSDTDGHGNAQPPRPIQPFAEPSSSDQGMCPPAAATLTELGVGLPMSPDGLVLLESLLGQPEFPDSGIESAGMPELGGADSAGRRDPLKGKAPQAEEATVNQEAKVSSKDMGKRRRKNADKHRESERKRRLNFKRKIKTLKSLVPSSEKDDTASILDEALKYMKSLKLQVEQNAQFVPMGRMNQGMCQATMASVPLYPSSHALPHQYPSPSVAPTLPWPLPAPYLPGTAVQLPHAPFSQQHGGFYSPSNLFPLPSTSLRTWLQEQQAPELNKVRKFMIKSFRAKLVACMAAS